MDAGLFPVSQPQGGAQQSSGPEAKITSKGNGQGQGFAQQLQQPATEGQSPIDGQVKIPPAEQVKKGEGLSQPSANLQETLMGNMQAQQIMAQMQEAAENVDIDMIDPKILKQLGAQLGDKDALLQSSPAIAFATGHLELIQPKDIPQIVTGSPFIQNALASGDIAKFMRTPVRVGELIEGLGLPGAAKDLAQQMGINLNQAVTPRQLLANLGVDPGTISAEMQMLKDNMQVDGLNQYMLRAAKLNKQQPQMAMGQSDKDQKVQSGQQKAPDAAAGVTAGMMMQDQQAVKAQAAQPQAGMQVASTKPGGADTKARGMSDLVDRMMSTRGPEQAGSVEMSQVERVTTDPTAKMTQTMEQLAAANKTKISGESLQQQIQKDPNQMISSRPEKGQQIAENMTFGGPAANASYGAMQKQNAQQANGVTDGSAVTDRLMAAQLMGQNGIEAATDLGQQSQNSGSEGQLGQKGEMNFGLEQARGSQAPTAQSSKADFVEIMKQAEATPKTVQREIVDKAQMLLKDGGGQIKLDFGKGEQRVELAMDVKNDSVNLKVLTASDHVKDILASDLPKLREALGQQNLQLNEVELGSHSKREWSNESFDQGQFQKEFAEQQESFNQKPGFSSKSSSRSYGSIVSAPVSNAMRPKHAGQIQVFA